MPITTFLHSGELNQPTGWPELDELLEKARQLSGLNYQIITKTETKWFLLPKHRKIYTLYVETTGVGPFQLISANSVYDYLQGVVDSHTCIDNTIDTVLEQARQLGRDTVKRHEESKKNIAYTSRLRDAVVLARNTFEGYAAIHLEKGTDDGNVKARLNLELAKQMNSALLPDNE